MKWTEVDQYRCPDPLGRYHGPGNTFGTFLIPSCYDRKDLFVIAVEDGDGWDHVSISRRDRRTPRWNEMCQIKDLFWNEDKTVVQFHPKKSEYVNLHESCLHLWCWRNGDFPTPDKGMV